MTNAYGIYDEVYEHAARNNRKIYLLTFLILT